VDWRTGDAAADDSAQGAGWDAERTVAAALLAELLTDAEGPRRPRALRLAGARIVGRLNLGATELVCPLLLWGCWFAEPVVLDEAQAPAVRLPSCHLPGLAAEQLTTRGNLELSDGFTATGEVNLSGAHIGGQVDLRGATLTNPEGYALIADRITVDHNMFCGDGFTARGEVSLLGADIGGQFGFYGATLTNPNGRTLDLQQLRAGALFLRDLTEPPALAEFTYAQVGTLLDEPASWPRHVILDGFVYDALYEDPPVSADQRLDWLARNPRGYSPQPYEQLAAVYRRAGRDQDARTVAIAKQRARRRALYRVKGRWRTLLSEWRTLSWPERRRRTLSWAEWLWSLLLDVLVGYGYRTWLAGVWLAGFWLVGWRVFDRAHGHNGLVLTTKPGEAYPDFHGAIYSLDTLLPVVDLHQQDVWIPRGGVQWWASASILAGWVLTTAVVAAMTGLLKRD
jgi:hypothetical protein